MVPRDRGRLILARNELKRETSCQLLSVRKQREVGANSRSAPKKNMINETQIEREKYLILEAFNSSDKVNASKLTKNESQRDGKFHLPSTMRQSGGIGSEMRAQLTTSTSNESRTMPPAQQHQAVRAASERQPHGASKLSNNLSQLSSPRSSAAAVGAAQPSYNYNNNNRPHHPQHHPHHHQHHSFIKTTTTTAPTTTATTTTAASLVYQIVIISLILHELPPLSSSTSSYQTTTATAIASRGLVAASLHPAPSASNQRQSASSVAGRHKRHLATMASAAHLGYEKQIDCHKLTAMWQYLHTSYPALAAHLLEWSSSDAAKQADDRFGWARTSGSSQAARTIGHLLDEAERLTAATTASGKRPLSSGDNNEHQRQLAGAAWLARVSSNPAYAKLVQHLRAKQMQQQHAGGAQHRQHLAPLASGERVAESSGQDEEDEGRGGKASGAGNGSGDGNGNGAEGEAASAASGGDGERIAASASAAGGATAGSSYGRLVHFPHEIGNTDNSHGMARTLDKLRLLSNHNRQQQQQQQQNIEETNRIPLASDVDQMTESDWRRMSETANDAARQNFVYGKVILTPSQAADHEQLTQQQPQLLHRGHHHYPRPLEILQGLQHEQERQRVAAAGGGHQSAPPNGHQAHDTGFGRVLSGPQMTGQHTGGGSNNDDKTTTHTNRHTAILAEQQQKHLQQAQQMGDELRALASDTASDELANQQQFQTMAVVETRPSESGDADFDELGSFHDGPLNKPEVRILRSTPAQQQPPEPVVAKTNNNLNFVVD